MSVRFEAFIKNFDGFESIDALLRGAGAEATAGDTAKAKATYKEFLALWKDADPDNPILKEAKSEFAKLQ